MPDLWEDAAKQFKSGPANNSQGTTAPAPPSSPGDDWKVWQSGGSEQPLGLTPGSEGSGPTSRFVTNLVSAVNPVPGIRSLVSDASNPQIGLGRSLYTHLVQPQVDQASKTADAVMGRGEFEHMPTSGRVSSALGHGLATALPLVGPAAAEAGDQIGSGDVAGGLGSATGLVGSVASPTILRGLGSGLKSIARPLAESALGVTMKDRLFDANPGKAALEETRGFRPSTVAASAHDQLENLKQEQGAEALRADANGATADLTPARTVVDRELNRSRGANATSTARQMEPMSNYFTKPGDAASFRGRLMPGPGTQPALPVIAPNQPVSQALSMRQEFPDNFRINYGGEPPKRLISTGRQAYRALSDEIKNTAPSVGEYDTRMHDLIPVAERAEKQEAKAPFLQRMAGRLGAHTGALVGGIEGYRLGGIPGAVAGVAIPEALADPTVQMAGARTLNTAGDLLRKPVTGQAARLVPLTGKSLNLQRNKNSN